MRYAKILTITEDCEPLIEVELEFGITVKKSVSFTGLSIIANKQNRNKLAKKLKFKRCQVALKDEGDGWWSGTFYSESENDKLGTNINEQLLEDETAQKRERLCDH